MTSDRPSNTAPITDLDVYFSAAEAFPAFEELCLSATRSIRCCFRVFDPSTSLHSDAGRGIGETWFDLLLHLLNRGVEIDITISDFDPIIATDDHRRSWRSARLLADLDELSTDARLTFAISMHPARVGYLPRRVLRSKIAGELEKRDADPLTPGLDGLEAGDDLPLMPATHHQKLAVVDEDALYIGGLDLNDRRYDTLLHQQASEQTWQDIQAIARGPVVAAAAAHLKSFRAVTEGEGEAPPQAPGFLRTLSSRRAQDLIHIAPKPLINEIEEAHLAAVERAEGLIYLETQFFRHKPLAEALVQAATQKDDLACILILPAAPEDVAFEGNDAEDARMGAQIQMEALQILTEGLGERLALASPAQCRSAEDVPQAAILHGAPLIYVHSKLSLFGRDEAILSSANLNGRSFRWDTEAGLHLSERAHVEPLWPRALDHWLLDTAPDPFGPPRDTVTRINQLLSENVAKSPEDRHHFLLPFDHSAQDRLASPLPFVPDEMV
ncbi:phospholipase D family protein [Jannaschia sp. CCS1]|uniref:phospholipase D family protein n=1 Tax=Jannaschia sp. (strain CCS1) TaxID=290400 RepID=UPI000053ACBC|nr:phosphatidylserine/phosphatidylglycerophosphate/cardiolipin synthase-like protein [Jannaschia sp. CCS1]ABD56480.1 Phosphatidylserine/phosphatidylglycerophosphate/cardiolipin synthases and related enzymes-like protein [Jannaschia sp. CCS1]